MTSFSWNKKVGEKVNITKRKNFEETSKDDVLVECVEAFEELDDGCEFF